MLAANNNKMLAIILCVRYYYRKAVECEEVYYFVLFKKVSINVQSVSITSKSFLFIEFNFYYHSAN